MDIRFRIFLYILIFDFFIMFVIFIVFVMNSFLLYFYEGDYYNYNFMLWEGRKK